MDDIKQLEKQIRILTKRLERSESDRVSLEDTKEKNDSLLRKVIGELETSREAIALKSEELEQALSELTEAQAELVQSAKMAALGELVAGVAHEINTPVGIGVTAASHLKEQIVEVEKAIEAGKLTRSTFSTFLNRCNESATIILNNLFRASELIQSFKLVAVDQSHSGARQFDVGDYIDEVLKSVGTQIKKTRHQLEVDGPKGLILDSDPGLLAQVITNLVMNALIHAFDEEDQGTLKILFYAEGQDLHFVFSDDGRGIPEDHLSKIFNPFFTTRRGTGGSGLGLNIIYNIVQRQMKGKVRCNSVVGQGTEFVIRIPGVVTTPPS